MCYISQDDTCEVQTRHRRMGAEGETRCGAIVLRRASDNNGLANVVRSVWEFDLF